MSNSASLPEMILDDTAKRAGEHLIDMNQYTNTLDMQTSILYSLSSNYLDYINE